MASWIDLDRTFCGNECANKECYRYQGQIPYGYAYPLSMALFKGTEDCEGWVSPNEETNMKGQNNG